MSTPLGEITPELLSEYTNSAHGYAEAQDGTVLRHFLPRYLELIAQGQPPHYGEYEFCLSRLRAAAWRSAWPARESDLLDRYFDALLLDHLADISVRRWTDRWRMAAPVDAIVTMAIHAGADVGRLLAAWRQAPDPGAVLHLSAFADRLTDEDGEPTLASPLLTDAPEARRAIAALLTDQAMRDRLMAAFFAMDASRPRQEIASHTLDLVDAFSSARR